MLLLSFFRFSAICPCVRPGFLVLHGMFFSLQLVLRVVLAASAVARSHISLFQNLFARLYPVVLEQGGIVPYLVVQRPACHFSIFVRPNSCFQTKQQQCTPVVKRDASQVIKPFNNITYSVENLRHTVCAPHATKSSPCVQSLMSTCSQ